MKIAAVCFTDSGEGIGARLAESFGDFALCRCPEDKTLAGWTHESVKNCDALVFIGAAGIAVRAIAPFVSSKASDRAVIVIDDCGKNVISLLSGHIGGANALASSMAQVLGANAVITTATDLHDVFAIDTWAVQRGFRIQNPSKIKAVSSKLLSGKTASVKSDFPIEGALPTGLVPAEEQSDIVITYREDLSEALKIIAPCLSLGIGCRRGASQEAVSDAFFAFCRSGGLSPLAFSRAFSIDLKKDEPGLLVFCTAQGLPFQTFAAEELEKIQGDFAASAFVKKTTGTDNVCERSAVLGSGGRLLASKYSANGVTLAAAINDLTVCF